MNTTCSRLYQNSYSFSNSLIYLYIFSAETQSIILQSLLSKFEFTSDEQTILSRGRNAGSSSGGRKRGPKRLYSSNKTDESGGPRVYQDSTAIEALLGYVYLTDEKRCVEIMEFISAELDQMDEMEGVVR